MINNYNKIRNNYKDNQRQQDKNKSPTNVKY